MSTTIVEKDSSGPAVLLIVVFLILLAGGVLGFAYMNGTFNGKTTVIENNKTIVLPASPPAAPADSKPGVVTP